MPINLKYGQQAVERGFITPQRLQQVLAKQRELAAQGKKVSIRMILEKAKLLNTGQLAQVDLDLNIKVVKKQTGRVNQVPPAPLKPAGADSFGGDAVPEFSGMSGGGIDATVFEPPPPDMQDRIRAERDKAKAEARQKQEADAAAFFEQNETSPFGGDPFGGGEIAPEPFGSMEPVGEMNPMQDAGEMQPEPMGEMSPEPAGDPFAANAMHDDGGLAPVQDDGMEELDRMDSSPKLHSLAAEFQGFSSPDEEELPSLDDGFDAPAQPQYQPPQPQYQAPHRPIPPVPVPSPAHADLAPGGGDFDSFGNDIMSPEDLEAGLPTSGVGTRPLGSNPAMDRTMFSPPPPGIGGREKTGATDRTMFSPRPPQFGGAPQPEPDNAAWGESGGMSEVDDPSAATIFSPPPPDVVSRNVGPQGKKPPSGRQSGDFGDVDIPAGKRFDDIPTAPATGEDVHPLRRNVTTSQPKSGSMRTPSNMMPAMEEFAGDLPTDEPSDMLNIPESKPAAKSSGRGAKVASKEPARDKFTPPKGKKDKGRKEEPKPAPRKKKDKRGTPRVVLVFSFLLILVVAILVLPVVLYDSVPQIRPLRDHYVGRPAFDWVEQVYGELRKMTGLEPAKPNRDPGANAPALPVNAPAETPPETPPETPAETPPESESREGG